MGSFWRQCDRTGFRVRAEDTRKEWNGLMVSDRVWEARHPQDLVRGAHDDQTVPEARPEMVTNFLGPLTTTLTAEAAAGANTLAVTSTTRMEGGDTIYITLYNGDTFRTLIATVPSTTSMTITGVLPYRAESGAMLVDITAASEGEIE